jgi:hypothetical protein
MLFVAAMAAGFGVIHYQDSLVLSCITRVDHLILDQQ